MQKQTALAAECELSSLINFIVSFLGALAISHLIETTIQESRKTHKKNKQDELLKKENELIKDFCNSQQYEYIIKIVQKYPHNNIPTEALSKLREILSPKWNFSIDQLEFIIKTERQTQAYINFKNNFPSPSTHILNDYIEIYADIYGEKDTDHFALFRKLLIERNIDVASVNLRDEINKHKRKVELNGFKEWLDSDQEAYSISDIDVLNGYEFEDILGKIFKNMGYSVSQTKLSSDQGADLLITKANKKIVVQAKCYSGVVGNKAVQEVVAAIKHYKAQQGMVVTNNYYTRSAIELAKSNNIKLVNRNELKILINKYLNMQNVEA